ncbi:MAG TPA: hypothetical protein VIG64_03155 [Actinomycetota bacterium]|jgi:hypothetical protein
MRSLSLALSLALVAGVMGAVPAPANHNEEDDHSDNLKQLALTPISISEDQNAQGSDLAFKGKLVITGSYQGIGIFKILKKKPYVKQISFLSCPGGQGDVSVLGKYVFMSVDSPRVGATCTPEDTAAASQSQVANAEAFEGIRVISIANPKRPEFKASVDLPCGSHTHTLLPGDTTSYIYNESYPLGAQTPDCSVVTHRKVPIVEFPTKDPTKVKLLDESIDVTPDIGCHDITTFPEKNLMVGACITESRIWDIKDPKHPEQLAVIQNPKISIHHSTAMTWDGKVLILGDEFGGAEGGGCTGDEDSEVGAAWFYDITDPASPKVLGSHSLPRVPQPASPDQADRVRCTNHNFNVIPMKDPSKYLLAVSYYMGGIAVVDFSDPANATEAGHYVTTRNGVSQDTWSAYWYQGRIYTNDYLSGLGLGVYTFDGTTSKSQTTFFKKGPLNKAGEMNPQVQLGFPQQ